MNYLFLTGLGTTIGATIVGGYKTFVHDVRLKKLMSAKEFTPKVNSDYVVIQGKIESTSDKSYPLIRQQYEVTKTKYGDSFKPETTTHHKTRIIADDLYLDSSKRVQIDSSLYYYIPTPQALEAYDVQAIRQGTLLTIFGYYNEGKRSVEAPKWYEVNTPAIVSLSCIHTIIDEWQNMSHMLGYYKYFLIVGILIISEALFIPT